MSVPSASPQPYIRQAGEHERLAYTGGAELAIILDAAITGGQFTVIEIHSRRGDASPVHVHGRDDEAFLLLDGAMTVWVGEARHQLWPGGIAFLPRGIPHAVRCDIASRALVLTTPAGPQETIFRAAGRAGRIVVRDPYPRCCHRPWVPEEVPPVLGADVGRDHSHPLRRPAPGAQTGRTPGTPGG